MQHQLIWYAAIAAIDTIRSFWTASLQKDTHLPRPSCRLHLLDQAKTVRCCIPATCLLGGKRQVIYPDATTYPNTTHIRPLTHIRTPHISGGLQHIRTTPEENLCPHPGPSVAKACRPVAGVGGIARRPGPPWEPRRLPDGGLMGARHRLMAAIVIQWMTWCCIEGLCTISGREWD
jgi:hypothetical protein